MKTIVLTVAALVAASTAADARSVRHAAPQAGVPSERVARVLPAPAWTAPIDNTRPAFAAHVGANGQGVD